VADSADIEKSCFDCRIDQDVEIAIVGIRSVSDRAEYSSVLRPMSLDDASDGFAMGIKCN